MGLPFYIAISMFFVLVVLSFELINFTTGKRNSMVKRLKDYENMAPINDGHQQHRFRKWLKMTSKRLASRTSEQKLGRVQELLDKSGLSRRYTPMEWQLLKQLVCMFFSSLALLLGWYLELHLSQSLILAVITFGSAQFAYRWIVLAKIKKRKNEMQRNLPFTLDLITISVQAGLSFDGAMLKVVETQSHALTWEFEKFLKEVRMGVLRRSALKNMIVRIDLDDFRTVIQAVIQADELGSSLSHVLKIQSEIMRNKRKMAAREKALKAPVKMLFPLIFFIFPAVFVIILGPAVIRIAEIFS